MWKQKIQDFLNQKVDPSWLAILFVSMVLFISHSWCFLKGWLIDDAGIAFSYARNFIHGFGLVSQPGVDPVEGFSDPLWVFILSPFFINNPADPTLIVKSLSLFFVFLGFVFVSKVNRLLFPERPWAMLVTLAVLLSLSINTSFVIWTSSGLENPLYFFLTSLCCFVSLKYMMSENRNDSLRGGLVCACLALTRPEGIIFAFIFPMLTVMKNMQGGRINRSFGADSAFFLLGFLVPVGLYEAFRYVYFKDVLPNTYWVKGTGGFFQGSQCHSFADFLKKITNLLRSMILPPLRWPLFLSTALAAFFAFRGFNKSLLASLFLMTCGALSVYCLLPYDWMPHYRFATPFFLCFYLLVFVLAAAGLSSIRFLSENARQILFILLTAVFFSQSWLVYWLPAKLFSRAPTVPFLAVARHCGFRSNYYAKALKITRPKFLGPDLGGTLYYSHARVYDLAGLCDRTIGRTINKDIKRLRNYVFETVQPTFIEIHGPWAFRPDLYSDPRFGRFYTPIFEEKNVNPKNKKKLISLRGFYVRKGSFSEDDLEWLQKHPFSK